MEITGTLPSHPESESDRYTWPETETLKTEWKTLESRETSATELPKKTQMNKEFKTAQ